MKHAEIASRGKPPLVCFPLFRPPRGSKFTPFVALWKDKGVSPPAGCDQRPAALDPRELFTKSSAKTFFEDIAERQSAKLSSGHRRTSVGKNFLQDIAERESAKTFFEDIAERESAKA